MQNRLITIFTAMFAAIVLLAGYMYEKPADTTLSYQTENLEVLKSAQPKDLLLCTAPGNETTAPIKRAVLIDQNLDNQLIGREVSKNMVNFAATYPYAAFDHCKVEALHPGESETAANTMTIILLFGFDSDKLAQAN